jgi:hypothetical protein
LHEQKPVFSESPIFQQLSLSTEHQPVVPHSCSPTHSARSSTIPEFSLPLTPTFSRAIVQWPEVILLIIGRGDSLALRCERRDELLVNRKLGPFGVDFSGLGVGVVNGVGGRLLRNEDFRRGVVVVVVTVVSRLAISAVNSFSKVSRFAMFVSESLEEL